MFLIGVISSIIAAVLQGLNYAITKSCQDTYHIYGFRMLIAEQLAIAFIVFWPFTFFKYYEFFEWRIILGLLEINIPFLMAQYFMIMALRSSDASIVSPLLVLKIPILTAISLILFHDSFELHQYFAITAILLLSWVFSSLSGQIRIRALIFIFAACFCYVLADIATVTLAKTFKAPPIEQAIILNIYNYIAALVFFIPCAFIKKVKLNDMYNCKYVAITWIVSSTLMVIAFNLSGVVSGNIIQSLRGAFGIVIVMMFFKDQIIDHKTKWQTKVTLSLLMTLSVVCFYI
ncbi:EamA family transporter [Succinatimonas hippei]|nr:EamA family transporter [Succinatimonas hippei]